MNGLSSHDIGQAIEETAASRRVSTIVLIYAVFAALWILLSDKAVAMLFTTPAQITQASLAKGWLFVAITTLLLYGLMKRMVESILAAAVRERETQIEKLHALQLLSEQEISYRILTEQVPAIVYRASVDEASKTTYISPQVEVLGYPAADWISNPDMWVSLLHPEDRERTLQALGKVHRDGDDFVAEYRLRAKNGEWRTFHDEARVIRDAQGKTQFVQGVMLDITEREKTKAESYKLLYYDGLTGLPNRVLLMDRLGQMLAISLREKRWGALIMLNIDRLKTLNDALGHDAGDALLKAFSERLLSALRDDDTMARLSGDEFAVLLYGMDHDLHASSGNANIVANKLQTALKQPFKHGGIETVVRVSMGVTLFPEVENDDPGKILQRADTAMHRAKKSGGNQTAFFEADMGEIASRRFQTELELRQAGPAGQLRLFLQPQVNAEGRMVSAEALIRWQHPTRGLVPPNDFIPLAEESDLIVELDTWMLREVCAVVAQREWDDRAFRIAVNTSPRNFLRTDFVSGVKALLKETGADPRHLTLEVTEGLMLAGVDDVVSKMTELAALGIAFSVDDFGTGYSSLAYLKQLPLHELKIDKTFVQDAPVNHDDAALVGAILSMAGHLRLRVVAEGVETQEQADFLNARAEVIHQGYLFGKPEPAENWIKRYRESDMIGNYPTRSFLVEAAAKPES
jgi:diguanylate cyclase (GGDEF)-like protein/PAS domain S-box-containing protein